MLQDEFKGETLKPHRGVAHLRMRVLLGQPQLAFRGARKSSSVLSLLGLPKNAKNTQPSRNGRGTMLFLMEAQGPWRFNVLVRVHFRNSFRIRSYKKMRPQVLWDLHLRNCWT